MRRYIEPMAMFMICLIIAIPIYSSSVYANINGVTAYGQEGISNFISQQYDLTVTADASLTNISVTPDLVKLKAGQIYSYFDSCSSSGNTSSLCTLNLVRGVNSEVEFCPQTVFNVELYEYKDALPIDTKSITVKCDSQGPSISMSISPVTNSGASLSYTLTDPDNSETKCSGISQIEFYLNSLSSGAATIIPTSSVCTYSDTTTIDTSAYSDGNYIVYLKAYDRLENSNVENVSFRIDKSAPSANASAIITDASGNAISYFTPQNTLVDVTLNINDATGIQDYSLNYSSLTTSAPACIVSGTNVVCTWNNIPMYLNSTSITQTITVQAADTLGNNATTSVPISSGLTQDVVAPTISISNAVISTTDGSIIEWYRPGPMRMSFSAYVTDDFSGIRSISGDFSNLQVISGDVPSCLGSGNSYSCSWSNLIFNIDSATFSKDIRVIAVDNSGNSKTETRTASASYKPDTSIPVLSNFKITRSTGQNISGWIGNQDVFATVSVDVSEQGSGLDFVKANLSNLNLIYSTYQDGDCTQTSSTAPTSTPTVNSTGVYQTYVGNTTSNTTVYLPQYTYTCEWPITIHFNSSGNPFSAQVQFNTSDKSANYVLNTLSQSFQVDLDSPTISSLITPYLYNGQYYVGADTATLIVGIADAGVGINDSNVYLDLTGIGFDANHHVTNCSAGYCYLYMPGCQSVSESVHTISVTTSTGDDLGNNLSSPFYANVTADLTRPRVDAINVTAVAANTPLYMNYTLTGNALSVVVNVTEATSLLSASGDFSNFISGANNVLADDCTRVQSNSTSNSTNTTSDKWVCNWATDAIDITAYAKENIYLNFTDAAGNSYIYPYELEVLEAMTGNVSYWDDQVGTPSPRAIDRQIVTFYNPSMWFPVGLISKEGLSASQRWPLEVSVENCYGSNITATSNSSNSSNSTTTTTSSVNYLSSANGNKPIIANPNTLTPSSLPYNMYMDYELEQAAPNTTDSINITCSLKVRTLVDGQKVSPYEFVNVTVEIKYYNNPLGTLDTNVQDEIDDVKGGWLVKAEWIGTINNILEIARSLCTLIQNLYALSKVVGGISDLLKPYPPTNGAGKALGNVAGGIGGAAEGSWESYVNGFCKFLNCQLYYGSDWGDQSSSGMFADWGRFATKYSKYWSPRDSLITSIVFLCLPGILYNLQKARVIDCQYINCLKRTAYGMPLQMCVTQRDYAWCKYVYGELFNLIPFANMISQIANKVKTMLQQPAEMISVGLKAICKVQCPTDSPCLACLVLEGTGLLLDLLCDFGVGSDQCTPFWEDLTVDDSVCDDALD